MMGGNHMKKWIVWLLVAALSLCCAALAEADGDDWTGQVLTDEALMAEYPYRALVDVNGDGAPVLIISTTGDAFIGAEDRAILYVCADGAPKQVMEIGGGGGEMFYCNAEEHTLTHFYRLSGEGHIEVYRIDGDALEPVTTADTYSPFHAPEDGDNEESVYLQDGAAIDEAASVALWAKYAGEADAISYGGGADATVDYGASERFTPADMDEAVERIRAEFSTWTGCELHSLRYAGDGCFTDENISWLKELEDADFTECMEFLSDFHSPVEGGGAWEPDAEYTDYQWWLAREAGGSWELVTWGY